MNYSAYIGRVGALAVALGVGAAVATGPGLAFAQESDSGSTNTGAESPSSPPSTNLETPSAGNGGDGQEAGGKIEPPEMNLGGGAAETPSDGTGDLDGDDPDVGIEIDPPDLETPPAGEGEGAESHVIDTKTPSGGESGGSSTQFTEPSETGHVVPPPSKEGDDDFGGLKTKDGGGIDTLDAPSGLTTSFDDSGSEGGAAFTSLALDEEAEEPAPRNPIASLISLPFRFVSEVLTAIVGAPGTPTGENPLLLALLNFARRPFETFGRTFSNHAPVITGALVEENEDGTFTITVDTDGDDAQASDPDGDPLTFTATNGEDGTVEKIGPATFRYTPPADWDGSDTITLTVSDPGGLFGVNRKSAKLDVTIEAADDDPTQPEITVPPTVSDDGNAQAELQFDPEKVINVTVAPGFEPKYWNVEETYNPETGKYEVILTPTQAGQLRAALGLDTTDTLGLEVTTTESQSVQPFAFRMASFAALADGPDYTVNLPDIPAGHFELRDPIVTSPEAPNPLVANPAGVVVTDRYAYVVNATVSTVTVIGADPEKADYLQKVDEIPVEQAAMLAALAGDRLYVPSGGGVITVIDIDGDDPLDEADDNSVLAPIEVGDIYGVLPVVSPDEKTIYLINQLQGKIDVIDVDPSSATYHTVISTIDVVDQEPETVVNDDGSITATAQFATSAVFDADGTRMYVVRNNQRYTGSTSEGIIEFTYTAELITIDTTTLKRVGDPVPLDGDYGYFSASDGSFAFVPTLTLNGFLPNTPGHEVSIIDGGVNVVDVRDPDYPVVVTTLPTGNLPVNVAFSPDNSLAYVVDAGTGTIWLIDTANQEVLDLDPDADGVQGLVFDDAPNAVLGQAFNVIAASPDGSRLFVTNYSKGTVVPLEFVRDDD